MKIASLAVAGLAALATLAPIGAAAQTVTRTVTHTRTVEHHGPALHRTRRVCEVHVRHGHRVRTCRTVRY